uniref:Uncharacterized protein n=1 Tax=Cacopsylla melanoneura TaxID=428564 RepID=A0A8D8W4U9_9HEMI
MLISSFYTMSTNKLESNTGLGFGHTGRNQENASLHNQCCQTINEDTDINEEKRSIYVPTVPYFQEKYGITKWTVSGLWFGVRGTASPFLKNFFLTNNLQKRRLQEMCLTILKDTMNIIQRHLYST